VAKIKKDFEKYKINYITPQKNYKKNKDTKPIKNNLLKKRHKVENYFANLKQFSRIRFMYEKLVSHYTGFLYLAIMCKTNDI